MKRAALALAAVLLVLLTACTAQAPEPSPTPVTQASPPTVAPTVVPSATPAPTAAPTATQAAASPAGNVLRIRQFAVPDTLDPQVAGYVDQIGHIGLLYEGLLTLDGDLKPIPAAAESWQVSDGGKVYTFKLRPGLKYSDGKPLTARNFEFALKRAADPTLGGTYQSSTFDIEGAEAYGSANPKSTPPEKLKELRDKVAVKALDDLTLEIRLARPVAYFPYIAALWITYPVREEQVAKGEDWSLTAENHIGNGPFVLKELNETAGQAVFVPNPNWRGPKPQVDQIVYRYIKESNVAFQAYRNGELDMTGLAAFDLPTVKSDPALSQQVLKTPGSCSYGYAFNLTKPPFDKREVRLAFAKAFDREAYTRDILQGLGTPSLSWLVPGIAGYEPNVGAAQKFDPAAAQALLAQAGYPNGQGLPEIKLTYVSTPRAKIINEFIADQYRKNLGVLLTLDPVESKLYQEMLKDVSTMPAFSNSGWCSDYPDPQDWFSLYWRSNGWAKLVGYKNETLDKLMDAADIEADPAKRVAMYQRVEKTILEDDVAFTPWYQGDNYTLVKPYVVYGQITSHDVAFPGWFEPWRLGVKR